jgi:hypothetical protein
VTAPSTPPGELAAAIRGVAAALRDRLAHAYGSLDWRRLHAEAPGHLAALEEFAARAAAATGLPP